MMADDCEQGVRLLADFTEGLSQEELSIKLGWSCSTVNDVLCVLRFRPVSAIRVEKVRVKGKTRAVTKYFLKGC